MTSQEGAEAAPAPEQQEEQVALSPEAPEPSAPDAAQTDSEAAEGDGYVDPGACSLLTMLAALLARQRVWGVISAADCARRPCPTHLEHYADTGADKPACARREAPAVPPGVELPQALAPRAVKHRYSRCVPRPTPQERYA